MRKILFVATVVKTHIMAFHVPYLKWFKKKGYEVHVCARNDYENKEDCNIPCCDEYFDLPFERQPFSKSNISAYKKLKNIIRSNNYDMIHCHTPMGGTLTRLAARKVRENGTRIIYTAHGFHFFKGAPMKNWLLYYPVEKYLANYTDCLITINEEDYKIAIENNFGAQSIKLINGVGVNLNRFKPQTIDMKRKLRHKYGFHESDFILIYAGELSYRKHQDLLINVVGILKKNIPNIRLLLAGTGELQDQYKKQADICGTANNIQFLGFRKDIAELMMLSDIAVSSSRHEGLPVNVMEAMAVGLPLVVTDCRGNRDLVVNNENGFVVEIGDVGDFAIKIKELYESKKLQKKYGERNIELIRSYSIDNIINEMGKLYNRELEQVIVYKGA